MEDPMTMNSTPANYSKKLTTALIGGATLWGTAPTWAHHSDAHSSTGASLAAVIDHLATPLAGTFVLVAIAGVVIARARKNAHVSSDKR